MLHSLDHVLVDLPERRLDLPDPALEVAHGEHEPLPVDLLLHALQCRLRVDQPRLCVGERGIRHAEDFSARVIWRHLSELVNVYVVREAALLLVYLCVNPKDLLTPIQVGEIDFDLDLEPPGAQERLVDEVEPVSHADDEDVV